MTYTDTFLRFPDKVTADALLFGEDSVALHRNTDVIGLVYRGDVSVEGWHVNVRLATGETIAADLEPYVIDAPTNPVRRYA